MLGETEVLRLPGRDTLLSNLPCPEPCCPKKSSNDKNEAPEGTALCTVLSTGEAGLKFRLCILISSSVRDHMGELYSRETNDGIETRTGVPVDVEKSHHLLTDQRISNMDASYAHQLRPILAQIGRTLYHANLWPELPMDHMAADSGKQDGLGLWSVILKVSGKCRNQPVRSMNVGPRLSACA